MVVNLDEDDDIGMSDESLNDLEQKICSKTQCHIENTIVQRGKFKGELCTFIRNNKRCDLCCRDDREIHNVEKNPITSAEVSPLPLLLPHSFTLLLKGRGYSLSSF